MLRMKKALRALLNGTQKVEMTFCLIGLITTTLLICAQVVNRYWLHFEIMWLNDLAMYCFVFFMFAAFTVTTWKKGHVSVDIFHNRLFKNKPVGGAFYRVFLGALSLVILSILLPVAYQFMVRAIKYPEYGTLVRWFNTSWLQIALFISLLLVLTHLLVILGSDIKEGIKVRRGHSQRKRK